MKTTTRGFFPMIRIAAITSLVATCVLWQGTNAVGEGGEKPGPAQVFGRIKYVTSFPDVKVRVVESFGDLKVQIVKAFADEPGEWEIVDSGEDFKVEIVTAFEDFTIEYVDSFPGPKK